jgi:hypothetical protein
MIANQIAGLLSGSVPALVTDYESIATVTVGAAQATVTFSSIPSTYTHLQVRIMGRATAATVEDQLIYRINGDTGANYAFHILYGSGSGSPVAQGYANETSIIPAARVAGSTAASSIYGVGVVDILDYANTNKFKTTRCLNGVDRNGAGTMYISSGLWRNTSAITSLSFTVQAGGNIDTNSSFALYGIK